MNEHEEHDFAAGEVVHDRDNKEPNDAVVVNVPPIPASGWDVRALEQTLAEANPDYPEDAQTVIVVFDETLAEYFKKTDTTGELESQIPIAELAAEHVQFYAFPAPRLEATGEHYIHSSESKAEPPTAEQGDLEAASSAGSATPDPEATIDSETEDDAAGIDALAERLADSGMRVVDRDDEEGTLTVAKMRDTYRVEPGRFIDGDGRFRQRLDELVATADDTNKE
jgi:hypothetical protein